MKVWLKKFKQNKNEKIEKIYEKIKPILKDLSINLKIIFSYYVNRNKWYFVKF